MMYSANNPPNNDETVMSKKLASMYSTAAGFFYTQTPDDVPPSAIVAIREMAHPHTATRSCPSHATDGFLAALRGQLADETETKVCKPAESTDCDSDVDGTSTTCESTESSTSNAGDIANVRDNTSLTEENILIDHNNSSTDEMLKYRLSLVQLCLSAESASKAHEARGGAPPPPPPGYPTDSQHARESRQPSTTTTTPEKVEAAQSAAVSKRERAGPETEASEWDSEDDVPLSKIARRFKEEELQQLQHDKDRLANRSSAQTANEMMMFSAFAYAYTEPSIGELFGDVLGDLEGMGDMPTDDLDPYVLDPYVLDLDELDSEGVVEMVMNENTETELDILWRVGLD